MYPSVHSQFRNFSQSLEGAIAYMYDDILDLVTVGYGNLIDPKSEALKLPFQFKQKAPKDQLVAGTPGAPATQEQIGAEWDRVKAEIKAGKTGLKNTYAYQHYAKITDLELSPAGIDQLVEKRLMENERALKAVWPEFADYEQWPADAQLALLSMAWAMGPYRAKHSGLIGFKPLRDALAKQDFDAAMNNCHMNDSKNAGLKPRNAANNLLFNNAAKVVADEGAVGYVRATLYYPAQLVANTVIVAGEAN